MAIRGPTGAKIAGYVPDPADSTRPLALRHRVARHNFQPVRIHPSPHAYQATSRNRLVGTEIRPSVPDLAPRRGATDEGPAPSRRPQGFRHAPKRDYPGASAPPSLGRVLIVSVFGVASVRMRTRPTRSRGAIVARGLSAPTPRQAVSRRLVGRSPLRARQRRSRRGDPTSNWPGRPHPLRCVCRPRHLSLLSPQIPRLLHGGRPRSPPVAAQAWVGPGERLALNLDMGLYQPSGPGMRDTTSEMSFSLNPESCG